MSKTDALDVVRSYFKRWSRKDYRDSRQYLDDHLEFRGPFDRFNRADDLTAALEKLAPAVESVNLRRTFVDVDQVCLVYDMRVVNLPEPVSVVELFDVGQSDKIVSIEAIFDARPFAALFRGAS